jgi:HEAT repeat protein
MNAGGQHSTLDFAFLCHERVALWLARPPYRVTLPTMPGKRSFEEQIVALESLRQQPPEACIEPLRKALHHRNNFVVAKAADLIREIRGRELNKPESVSAELTPDVLTAFHRFFENPVKTDPQCWAKNSLSRALAAFEHQDAAVFLRGMSHIQLEPVWGGRSDTAGTLRATCALALVQCRSLTEPDLLAHLLELLGDKDKSVRVEVVRAIEQVGSPSAALLLRLRAVLGSDEPEVLGACYSGILRIEGASAISWVSGFLASADDPAAEAALAIAGTHSPQGFEALRAHFADQPDPWFRSVLLSAIALTRQDAAIEFLFDLVRTESLQAEAAIEAILRAAPSAELSKRLEKMVAANQRLARVFDAHRSQHVRNALSS